MVEAPLTEVERHYEAKTVGMTARERKQFRVDHGMCPECGREAAPYYLCGQHRTLGAMTRMLNRMANRRTIKKEKVGRANHWSILKGGAEVADFQWAKSAFEMEASDKRLRPRLNRRPVDLDETLHEIFITAGKPLLMEEIYAAWGKLRSKRKSASLAGDMAAIIQAERRRAERNAKRAARGQGCRVGGV